MIVDVARRWIGTPYCHGASVRGVGCDCLGLIRGVYRDHLGKPPGMVPPYGPDWAEATRADLLASGFRQNLVEKPGKEPASGDILLFRLKADGFARHAAIFTGPDHMIHAWERSSVCEVPMGRFWRRCIVNIFKFPEKN